MSEVIIKNTKLTYEILGDTGPAIALTSGGQYSREGMRPFAQKLQDSFRVLIWDRRNCGDSDLYLNAIPDEMQVWAGDLHELLDYLGLLPAYVGGSSSGTLTSLRYAVSFPSDVRGLLLLNPPLAEPDDVGNFCQKAWGKLADIAVANGMVAAIDEGWLGQLAANYPRHRERLLSVNPKEFASALRSWISVWQAKSSYWGISVSSLEGITTPAIIFSNENNATHPWSSVEMLCNEMPNSVRPEMAPEEAEEINSKWRDGLHEPYQNAMVSAWKKFIQRMENKSY